MYFFLRIHTFPIRSKKTVVYVFFLFSYKRRLLILGAKFPERTINRQLLTDNR